MIITSFGLGIAIGFLFFELTGLTAGGIIVPGYIALYIEKPGAILTTIFVAILTYGIVTILSRWMIVFGRRRFLLMVLTGFLIQMLLDTIIVTYIETSVDLRVIGYIIPGLIANEFSRQGIGKTVMAMIIVSGLVYLILQIIFYSIF